MLHPILHFVLHCVLTVYRYGLVQYFSTIIKHNKSRTRRPVCFEALQWEHMSREYFKLKSRKQPNWNPAESKWFWTNNYGFQHSTIEISAYSILYFMQIRSISIKQNITMLDRAIYFPGWFKNNVTVSFLITQAKRITKIELSDQFENQPILSPSKNI